MRGVRAKLIRKKVYQDYSLREDRKYETERRKDSFNSWRIRYVVLGLRSKYQAAKKAYKERHWRNDSKGIDQRTTESKP
jgi:hypothetical protein